jgi:hypothetical protein
VIALILTTLTPRSYARPAHPSPRSERLTSLGSPNRHGGRTRGWIPPRGAAARGRLGWLPQGRSGHETVTREPTAGATLCDALDPTSCHDKETP